MFEEWGFLLTEIWMLLVLAALVGLIAGWLIFGGKSGSASNSGDADRLRSENATLHARMKALEAQTGTAGVPIAGAAAVTAMKPEQLDAPNNGKADDLKRIKGVGPRMEQMCNMLGFWHYDQIANWSAEEVTWVDENLQGFKGRVTRDDWVPQAKILAAGGETEFSKEQDAKTAAAKKAKDEANR